MPVDPLTATQTGVAATDFAIKQGIFNFLKRNYGYVKDMSKNYDKLMKEYKELCGEEDDVTKEVERNEIEKEKTNACKGWLKKVQEMKKDVEELKAKYKKSFSCMCGLCPFCCLVKLGGQIVKKTEKVRNLKAEIRNMRSLMIPKAPTPYITNPTNKISEFPSLEENVKELQDYLIVENLKRICVLGPIGVGKSTIMNRLHQAMKESKMFEFVFLIAVGRNRDGRYIQQELLRRLRIKLKKFSDEERKSIIHEQLKDSRYLLLLDEVFSKIDLEQIGINDEHKGKIVFASRYLDVCEQADEHIEVKRLSDMDAQNMFWEIVGMHLKDNPHIKIEAELIIKFCSSNPHLIKLIGKHLATKARVHATNGTDPAIWRNTLHELTSPTGEPVRARVYVKKKRGSRKAKLETQIEGSADRNGKNNTGKLTGEQSDKAPGDSNSVAVKVADMQQKYGDLLEKKGTLKVLEAELARKDWWGYSEEPYDKSLEGEGVGDMKK